ncbi:hypothetical protein PVAND_010951 [Polypedilum vanderplanki]|uniref:Uncharacterized protein n=1 Tax=Polypedilum vanderplanki TaxID=319348 RepID=A0A9J6CHU8_POLVA|nr:hypothetical protein PVAND_010951 [Polypedilum vanderplanki]
MREIKQVIVAVYFFCNYIYADENFGVPCGQEELQRCAAQLKAVEGTREFNFVYNKEELDRICPDLHMGLQCIKSYSRRCMSQHEREHINKIYDGTNEMIRDLCMEGQYQQDFLRYSPCMHKVRNEYDHCKTDYQRSMEILYGRKSVETTTTTTTTTQSPRFMQISLMKRQQMNSAYVTLETTTTLPVKNISSDVSDQDKLQIVCCAFQRYMDCSASAVEKACGNETAEFTRNFLTKMLSALMRMHCQQIQFQCQNETGSSRSISPLIQLVVVNIITAIAITKYP